MERFQLDNILQFRLGAAQTHTLVLDPSIDRVSLLAIDKAIFRKKLPSGKYTYFILNSRTLDSIRSLKPHPSSNTSTLAYKYLVSRIYNPNMLFPLPEELKGFTLTGLDIAIDVKLDDLSSKFGFSFDFFQRLLVGAYSSCSKRIIMSLDAFTRYMIRNNKAAKSSQSSFYELYNVKENKFCAQAEVSAGALLMEIQKRGSTLGVPSDFFFGKEQLKRSRVSSSIFSFDLDIYDKGAKESNTGVYKDLTRFELRFRGCDRVLARPRFLFNESSDDNRTILVEQEFLAFLDRSILLRQRPNKRISKTSFSNLYKWSEDTWWSAIKSRIFNGKVLHLDEYLVVKKKLV